MTKQTNPIHILEGNVSSIETLVADLKEKISSLEPDIEALAKHAFMLGYESAKAGSLERAWLNARIDLGLN